MERAERISDYLQAQLRTRRLADVSAVEAAKWLDRAGLLTDSRSRPGRNLRSLLRDGKIPNAEQRPPQPYGNWFIIRR